MDVHESRHGRLVGMCNSVQEILYGSLFIRNYQPRGYYTAESAVARSVT